MILAAAHHVTAHHVTPVTNAAGWAVLIVLIIVVIAVIARLLTGR